MVQKLYFPRVESLKHCQSSKDLCCILGQPIAPVYAAKMLRGAGGGAERTQASGRIDLCHDSLPLPPDHPPANHLAASYRMDGFDPSFPPPQIRLVPALLLSHSSSAWPPCHAALHLHLPQELLEARHVSYLGCVPSSGRHSVNTY